MSSNTTQNSNRSQYEIDWDRIIFSSPFRRLQNKTQVFPLPEEVFVHNRLTHSLEVASVGRSLGKIIGEKIAEMIGIDDNAKHFYKNHLKNVISAACLAHDLGNPAFGHSGEEAISKYFKKMNTCEIAKFKEQFALNNHQWDDLITFEGNANTLRILTAQRKGRVEGGFRLTYSTLGATIKYPCDSSSSNKKILHRKKYGYFQIDEEAFTAIARELNMIKDEGAHHGYKRHPFVYLVEAADDICYKVIDFEDAHRLGVLDYTEVKKTFIKIIEHNTNENIAKVKLQLEKLESDKNEALSYLRSKVINTLTLKVVDVFMNNAERILVGNYSKSLLDDVEDNPLTDSEDTLVDVLKEIGKISREKIYNARQVVKLEIAGFTIMSSLVEDFVTAVLTKKDKRQKEHEKLISLIPSQFSFDENATAYEKVMCVLDFISGMTDLFALKLYRNLKGIEI
jgi:dGTPase